MTSSLVGSEMCIRDRLDILATLATKIAKTQQQIRLIDTDADVGNVAPPPPPGNWTRNTKPRTMRTW
eukprot:6292900-Prorocentrum_lima.AAC.1